MLAGGAVSWASQRQNSISLSSTEAEYVALSIAAQECVWLRRFLKECGYEPKGSTVIYEDNQGTIALVRNPVNHRRSKHIDIRYHYTREQVGSGSIVLEYCNTNNMAADMLTKSVSRVKHNAFRKQVGVL